MRQRRGLNVFVFLAVKNFSVSIGADKALVYVLQGIVYAALLAGIVWAIYLRMKRPAVYARIGRQ